LARSQAIQTQSGPGLNARSGSLFAADNEVFGKGMYESHMLLIGSGHYNSFEKMGH